MQLIIDTIGTSIRKKNQSFLIELEATKRMISPSKISSIIITKTCMISTAAIELALEKNIVIILLDGAGNPFGRFHKSSFGADATIRRMQVVHANSAIINNWVVSLLSLKVEGQINNLKYLVDRRMAKQPEIQPLITKMELFDLSVLNGVTLLTNRDVIRNTEAQLGKLYWQAIEIFLKPEYTFINRGERPAQDIFNATLNYCYGMLYNAVESSIVAANLDPQLGFMHVDTYNSPTLSFDLIEPFRPWADKFLLDLCLDNKLNSRHFDIKGKAYWLNREGKKLIIPGFNTFMDMPTRMFGKQKARENMILESAAQLVQLLKGI